MLRVGKLTPSLTGVAMFRQSFDDRLPSSSSDFPNFLIDYDRTCPYIALAQSRTCLWVSAGPSNGEEIGKVTGANPSGRFSGQPPTRGHLEATTVRAFLVLFRLSKDRGY